MSRASSLRVSTRVVALVAGGAALSALVVQAGFGTPRAANTTNGSAHQRTAAQQRLDHKPAYLLLHPRLTATPRPVSTSRNSIFAWVLQRSTTAECRLDHRAWKSCTSPKTYLALHLGTHVFRVRANRTHGRRRSSVTRFTWKIVSSTPPAASTITAGPDEDTTSTDAVFGFDVAAGTGFECRLDGSGWQQCSNPAVYVGLGTGTHMFCVRAIGPGAVAGPKTCTTWTVHSPAQSPQPSAAFTISGSLPTLLSPGAGGPLQLTVANPFDFDLRVTALTVAVKPGSSRPGCDGAANLRLTQSNTAGGLLSIVVPAHGSTTLPAQGATAPQLTMLDLATNQDSCKNAVFTFSFSGTGTRA